MKTYIYICTEICIAIFMCIRLCIQQILMMLSPFLCLLLLWLLHLLLFMLLLLLLALALPTLNRFVHAGRAHPHPQRPSARLPRLPRPPDPTNVAAPCPPCSALATDALMLITDPDLTAADVAASPLVPPATPSQPAQVYIDNCSDMVICICTCRQYMISHYSVMYV